MQDRGCRNSPYHSLEVHVHLQMLYSPLRVLDPNEADIVYAHAPGFPQAWLIPL